MNKTILSKAIINKVEYEGEKYLRVYNIDEKEENKGNLINLKFFHEIQPNVYLPLFYEKDSDEGLFRRLRTTDMNEDTLVSSKDIELFLSSLNLYVENTYDVIKSTVESLIPGYSLILYKEYLSIFYVVLSNGSDVFIYEIKIDKNGKISLLYLEDNVAEIIITRDFSRYINETSEFYIKINDKRYIVVLNIDENKCFVDIKISQEKDNIIKSIKMLDNINNYDVNLVLNILKDRFNI